jgi:hypothetical protein
MKQLQKTHSAAISALHNCLCLQLQSCLFYQHVLCQWIPDSDTAQQIKWNPHHLCCSSCIWKVFIHCHSRWKPLCIPSCNNTLTTVAPGCSGIKGATLSPDWSGIFNACSSTHIALSHEVGNTSPIAIYMQSCNSRHHGLQSQAWSPQPRLLWCLESSWAYY